MADPFVEVQNVWKRFGRQWVLRDLSLAVERGEVVALLGPNGVGKTTLLRVIATLIRPQRGTVRLFGKPARALEAERGRIALVANPPAFYRHLSGEENLEQSLALAGRPIARAEALEAMARVGLPEGRAVAAYSSGMRKRLALARTLLARPQLLLLDEPETALDAGGREELVRVIGEVAREGAVVLATHDHGFAAEVATRSFAMGAQA
ncbi:ABC transporter ATP-binding protein [Oceanithermus desulfurans]|uniref:ABC transporter ATP-binding protein n=2 Tax=Oceanithermus desulfurans TaxID=227924 RepID=A0A511RIG1_9DEIN|nr:ABC transporter ATP-binding protein [Oceanithermus desulfurans]MBB6030691.1 heme exporter protein A [Oceanithermus desulfurans]GEM89430.1 ABC transporter ATP-binding protein [Oceanithermus desulfurans NBRC 100063]